MPRYTPEQTLILRFAQVLNSAGNTEDVWSGLCQLADETNIDLKPFEAEDAYFDHVKLEAALNPEKKGGKPR